MASLNRYTKAVHFLLWLGLSVVSNIVLIDGQKYLAVGWREKFVRSKKKNTGRFTYQPIRNKSKSNRGLPVRAGFPALGVRTFGFLLPTRGSRWICFALCSDWLNVLERFSLDCRKVICFALLSST